MQLQLIFDQKIAIEKQIKDIKLVIKDALSTSLEYKEITAKLTTLREKKKQIEGAIKSGFKSELNKLDDLEIDLASQKELLTDAALTQYAKGEALELTDQYDNKYEPVFSARFKKA